MKKNRSKSPNAGSTPEFRCTVEISCPAGSYHKKYRASGEKLVLLDKCRRAFKLSRTAFIRANALGELPGQPKKRDFYYPERPQLPERYGAMDVQVPPKVLELVEKLLPFTAYKSASDFLIWSLADSIACFFDDLIFHPITGEPLAEEDSWNDGTDRDKLMYPARPTHLKN